jgi:hypothetical protein
MSSEVQPRVKWPGRRSGGIGATTGRFDTAFDLGLAALALFTLIASTIHLVQEVPAQWAEALLLFFNGAVSIFGFMVAIRRTRPIFLVVFFFDFIFFSIGPLEQLAIFEDPIYGDDRLLDLAIFLCTGFCILGLPFVLGQGKIVPARQTGFMYRSIFDYEFHPQLLCLVTVILSLALLAFYWPVLLDTREAMDRLLMGTFDKTASILFVSFLNPLSFIAAVIGWAAARNQRSYAWVSVFAFCLVLAVLVNNPFNFARFRVSTLMVFAFLVYFGFQRLRLLSVLLIVGTLLSGTLNSFRYNQFVLDPTAANGSLFSAMDFHALNLICYAIKYATDVGYSYGSNLLGALLFFVPRAIWEGKSEHIAYYFFDLIRKYRYYGTDNLASPVVAEGYFAFGIVGAILLSVLVFWVFRFIEKRGLAAPAGTPWQLILCLSPMLTFILLRGPLIVGFSEFCGHIAALLAAIALLVAPIGGGASRRRRLPG